MAEKSKNKKASQLTLDEYRKIKEKKAQSRLKLQFPWPVKIFLILPACYFLFLILYYLIYIRFTPQH